MNIMSTGCNPARKLGFKRVTGVKFNPDDTKQVNIINKIKEAVKTNPSLAIGKTNTEGVLAVCDGADAAIAKGLRLEKEELKIFPDKLVDLRDEPICWGTGNQITIATEKITGTIQPYSC